MLSSYLDAAPGLLGMTPEELKEEVRVDAAGLPEHEIVRPPERPSFGGKRASLFGEDCRMTAAEVIEAEYYKSLPPKVELATRKKARPAPEPFTGKSLLGDA